jgi:hypothetical protein
MTTNNDELTFTIAAMSYHNNRAGAAAYERILRAFSTSVNCGDSFYRCLVRGVPTLVILSWMLDDAHLAAIAALPWGDGTPVVLPPAVGQQLAQRSLAAAPKHPNTIRRIYRDPAGRVLRDHEFPDRGRKRKPKRKRQHR